MSNCLKKKRDMLMKGIKLTILFSSLILGLYADGYDASDSIAAKGYFPDTEAETPSSTTPSPSGKNSNNSNTNNPKKQKKWTPEEGDDSSNDPSFLQPKEGGKGYFPAE